MNRSVALVVVLVLAVAGLLTWVFVGGANDEDRERPLEASSAAANARSSADSAAIGAADERSKAPTRASVSEIADLDTIAGVVVDEKGAFIEGALVEAWAADAKAPDVGEAEQRTTSLAKGRYSIAAPFDAKRIALRATHADFLASDVRDVVRGTQTLRLVLKSGGSLPVSILLPGKQNFGDLALRVADETTGAIVHTFTWGDAFGARASIGAASAGAEEVNSPDGRETQLTLRFRMPAGSYAFSVSLRDGQEPLVLVPNVVVEAGLVRREPRVDPIDLRGALFPICLRVVDEKGLPVGSGWRQVLDHGFEMPTRRGAFLNGNACFYSRTQRVDVLVGADGFQTAKLGAVDGDREVVLRRALSYELTVSGVKPLDAPAKLRAVLVPAGTFARDLGTTWKFDLDGLDDALIERLSEEAPFLRAIDVGADGKVVLGASERGKHELRFFVATSTDASSILSITEIEQDPPVVVEIVEERTEGACELDPRRVEEALAKLRADGR